MRVGTKSVLFGAHQFLIHPWFVAYAWWKLYGLPLDPRLWVAFFIHDLGYWGKPNIDGPEGEQHPVWAARMMKKLFGWEWYKFCKYHSRFLAKIENEPYSKLCPADKLALALEPWWFYLPRVILSGEINEYMSLVKTKYKTSPITNESKVKWFKSVKIYMEWWAYEHRNIKKDELTQVSNQRETKSCQND